MIRVLQHPVKTMEYVRISQIMTTRVDASLDSMVATANSTTLACMILAYMEDTATASMANSCVNVQLAGEFRNDFVFNSYSASHDN